MPEKTDEARLEVSRSNQETLLIRLAGEWRTGRDLPSVEALLQPLKSEEGIGRVSFDTAGLTGWDSSLVTRLLKVFAHCEEAGLVADRSGLPDGVVRLVALASEVPEREGARRAADREPFLARVGTSAIAFGRSTVEILGFIGEATRSFLRLLKGKAQFRRRDLIQLLQECGADALPIVSLISLLVGLILAFVGAVQLMMFGAQIYVADLVGIAMVRVMGAVMTGIIMAGRTGAAFASQLGTMQVNEEIDALETFGISPMDFLVLPRLLALTLMMPLLCLYADLMGVLGGMLVSTLMLDINLLQYYHETRAALTLTQVWIGLVQSVVFGLLVATAGCLRGMQCGRSASAVGDATTSAVVTSIVAIIVATGIITVICNALGI